MMKELKKALDEIKDRKKILELKEIISKLRNKKLQLIRNENNS